MLLLQRLPSVPTWDDIAKLETIRLTTTKEIPCRLAIGRTDKELVFFASVNAKPQCDFSNSAGSYVKGLWRQDCAELFIASKATGRYLEINLAPTGAWWAMAFQGPRTEAPIQPKYAAIAKSQIEGESWRAMVSIPWEIVETAIGNCSELSANVTLILGGCDDDYPDPRNLSSFVNLGDGEPNFHRPDLFCPLIQAVAASASELNIVE